MQNSSNLARVTVSRASCVVQTVSSVLECTTGHMLDVRRRREVRSLVAQLGKGWDLNHALYETFSFHIEDVVA